MSLQLTAAVWDATTITDSNQMLLLLAMADSTDSANEYHASTPDLDLLCRLTRMSQYEIQRVIAALTAKQILRAVKPPRPGAIIAYRIVLP